MRIDANVDLITHQTEHAIYWYEWNNKDCVVSLF